jgi:hypothetical protein
MPSTGCLANVPVRLCSRRGKLSVRLIGRQSKLPVRLIDRQGRLPVRLPCQEGKFASRPHCCTGVIDLSRLLLMALSCAVQERKQEVGEKRRVRSRAVVRAGVFSQSAATGIGAPVFEEDEVTRHVHQPIPFAKEKDLLLC